MHICVYVCMYMYMYVYNTWYYIVVCHVALHHLPAGGDGAPPQLERATAHAK